MKSLKKQSHIHFTFSSHFSAQYDWAYIHGYACPCFSVALLLCVIAWWSYSLHCNLVLQVVATTCMQLIQPWACIYNLPFLHKCHMLHPFLSSTSLGLWGHYAKTLVTSFNEIFHISLLHSNKELDRTHCLLQTMTLLLLNKAQLCCTLSSDFYGFWQWVMS